MMNRRFSPEVEGLLRRSGWFEGRAVDLRAWEAILVRPSNAARAVLREFGGLQLGETGPGIEQARSDVDLRPGSFDGAFVGDRQLETRIGEELYPIGSAHRHNFDLMIGASGRVYATGETVLYIAPSFDSALECLLLGKNSPPGPTF